ncbi:MAG: hypothetical protein ABJH05_03755 [Fulvivirga sp.]
MELKDLVVAPIVIFIVLAVAYKIKPQVTDTNTKSYFIPALSLKIISAILLGVIYQFYYGYGDTLNYHSKGSRHIYNALINEPMKGIKLLLGGGEYEAETFLYASKIVFYQYDNAYLIVKIAAILDIFTFSSYAGTAVLFAALSFIGCWMMFLVLYKRFPHLKTYFAIAIFFVPSVFFWGSGILKDTVTFAAIGVALYYFDLIFRKKFNPLNIIFLLVSLYLIFLVKKYILICFVPGLVIWYSWDYIQSIRIKLLRLIVAPLVISITMIFAFWVISKVGEFDERYAIENIGETARITGVDLAFGTGKGAGSTYVLGELDGSLTSMVQLFPEAVNVTLFRPYLWEVNNALMLIAALESLAILLFTLFVLYKVKFVGMFRLAKEPFVLFCLVFSIVFAFAVGVSTFNFGTLMRYKIPIIPFYLSALVIIYDLHKQKYSQTVNQA